MAPLSLTDVAAAQARLTQARLSGVPCAPVRDLIDAGDVAAAYAVQAGWVAGRLAAGARVTGRKIGLTNPVVQQQLGVDSPDFGVLLEEMGALDGATVDIGTLLQPRIEAEVAFVLGRNLDRPDVGVDEVAAATESVAAALEIVDSRIAGWDISLVDTVADNGSAAAYVVGRTPWPLDRDLAAVTMSMSLNGAVVSTGEGRACLGSPVLAVAWLARTAYALGDPLRAGEVVLSGALGPMVPVAAGDHVTAEVSGLGSVSVRFA